jgi:hypothetical protein
VVALALVITKSLKVDFAVALAVRVVPEADMPVVVPDPLHVPLLRVNVYVFDPVAVQCQCHRGAAAHIGCQQDS